MSRAKKFLVLAAACAGIIAGAATPALTDHPPSVAEQDSRSPGQLQANRQGTSTPVAASIPDRRSDASPAAVGAAGPVKPTGPDQGNRHGT